MFATPFPMNAKASSSAFPFASLLHIDAQQIPGADATKITTTPNLGTAAGNITSPNGTNTPQIHTGGQNGMRYLAYTGGSGSYHNGDATLISGLGTSAPMTMFCVCSLVKQTPTGMIFDGGSQSGATLPRFSQVDTLGMAFGRTGTFIRIPNASYTAGAIKCLSATIDSTSSIFRTNGIADVTGTISTGSNAWTAFTIAAQDTTFANLLAFDLYEMIFVSGALSAGDITAGETFLVNKYALT